MDELVNVDRSPLDLVRMSRMMNPVSPDLSSYLNAFLQEVKSSEDVEVFAIPMIISSFILDQYPPNMHPFRPEQVFRVLYDDACQRLLQKSQRDPQRPIGYDIPTTFTELAEEEMIKQYKQYRRSVSAVAHHRTMMNCFRHSHSLCENCVQVFGKNEDDMPWTFVVRTCPLCSQEDSGAIIGVKPPTASIRVLSIDGGGTRGRAPLAFLQTLQDRLQLPTPVQHNFDFIYGTSSGAIIAAVLYALDWSIEECTEYFDMFARVAFQPRWWWLKVPFLSAVLQMVASLLADSRYSSKNLETILQDVMGTRSLMDCTSGAARGTKLGITVTTIRDARACVFTSYNGAGERRHDTDYQVLSPKNGLSRIPLWEIVRCSTAAPYYFKVKHIPDVGTFQDGGLMFNNPASKAVREVAALFPDASEPGLVVSLGTGSSTPSNPPPATNERHFLRDSFPARVYRAFWSSGDSKRAWQQLVDHTKDDPSNVLFRFDVEYDGRPPALDSVAEMEHIGRLARETIQDSPMLSKLVHRIRAELFVFELDPLHGARFRNGEIECSGRIICRLRASNDGLRAFVSQFIDRSAFFRIGNRTVSISSRSNSGSSENNMAPFTMNVRFAVANRNEPFAIRLCEDDDQGCHISGSPFTLEKLFTQQHLGAYFGSPNHKKRSNTSEQERRGKKHRRTEA
ncbi:uncharacterized protein JN550_013691 [Neoarthrinium moseri]|uniref:uncharacterized protein n=1 Tax=Neoarthrinium moseri TaxID=1658444 RepID=UPI001FDB71B1|nr:uncharacterized protein JN550_013691 [Neoarthrinium moseri]KAI1856697.1 hypothetical protein JN550_013691 [Neoarthrinium moseri]